MPTIQPANTQQILSMGTHVEKIQQTAQQLAGVTSQQLDEERALQDEMKGSEVQDMEESNPSDQANPEGKNRRGRLKIRKRSREKETAAENGPDLPLAGGPEQGTKINVVV